MSKKWDELTEKLMASQIEAATLQSKLAASEEKARFLQERMDAMDAQIERLQSALVAKEAPQAYSDQQAVFEETIPVAQQERTKRLAVANRELLDMTVQPLFHDAEDMMEMLLSRTGPPKTRSGLNEEG